MTEEIWKPVPGYEGAYEASTLGRVRSVPHYVRVVCHGVETKRLSPGKILRPGVSSDKHLSVSLGRNNSIPVHTVVMLTFVGPRPPEMDVAHNDGDPTNNALSNLRYASRSGNNQDVVFHGRRRFSVEEIKSIRSRVISGGRGAQARLAREFGVHISTINAIVHRRYYVQVR